MISNAFFWKPEEKKKHFLTVVFFVVVNIKSDDTADVFTGHEFSGELFTVQEL